jgi:hypothetical protein
MKRGSSFPIYQRLLAKSRLYAYRMRVEAPFQDTKSRRWCIESSQLRDTRHLNRWLLIIFIAFWWTTHLGASCKHHGHAKAFDRADRYDKSLLLLPTSVDQRDPQTSQFGIAATICN